MSTKEIFNNPWAIVSALVGLAGVGGNMGYNHVMEKFWHPVNDRIDKVIVQQKVLIYLGHTEDEISEAWYLASKEFYEERLEENMTKLKIPTRGEE